MVSAGHFIYIVFLLALFPFLYSLARETALIEAGKIRRGETARRIALVFKADADIKKLKILPQELPSPGPIIKARVYIATNMKEYIGLDCRRLAI